MNGVKEILTFLLILIVMLVINTAILWLSYIITNKDLQKRVNNKKMAIIGIILVGFYLLMQFFSTAGKVMTDFASDYLIQNIIFERGLAFVVFVAFYIAKIIISNKENILIKKIYPYRVKYTDEGETRYYIDNKYKNCGKELYKIATAIMVVFAFGQAIFVYNNMQYFVFGDFVSNYAYLLCMALIYLIVFEIGVALDGELEPDALGNETFTIKKDRFNEMINEYKTKFKDQFLLSLDKDDDVKKNVKITTDDSIFSKVFTPAIEGKNLIIETEKLSSLDDIIPPLINLIFGMNRRIMFITEDDADSIATYNWLRKSNVITDNVNKVVQVFLEGEEVTIINDTNVNICIGSVDLLLENHEITKYCDTIFAINIDSIIVNSPINLSILARILVEDKEKDIQYIFFANAVNDLKQSIEGVFYAEDFIYHVVRTKIVRNFHSLFFAKDKGDIQHEILPGIAKDSIGSVLPLLITPVKYDYNSLYGFSSKAPYEDEMTYLHIHTPELKSYVGSVLASDIDGLIKYEAHEYFSDSKDSMIVTYDDSENNLVSVLNKYLKYASSRILVNIVSNKYILRDYLIDNIDFFMQNATLIGKIVPYQKEGKKLSLFKLINELCLVEFEEETLVNELNKLVNEHFDFNYNSNPESFIKDSLHCLIKEVFGADLFIDNYINKELVSENVIKQRYTYKLSDDIKYELPSDLFKQIRFEASDQQLKMLKRVPVYEVYQNYATDIYVVFNGKTYRIDSIDSDQGIIKLRSDSKPTYIEYRFKKDVNATFIDNSCTSNLVDLGKIKYIKSNISIDANVKYDGYYEFKEGFDFTKDYKYIKSKSGQYSKENIYKNQKAYVVTFTSEIINGMDDKQKFKIAETFVFILNEMFKTLYNGADQYLILRAISSVKNYDNDLFNLYSPIELLNNTNNDISNGISLLIMEDTGLEKGLLDSFIIKLDTSIIPLITDYIEWVIENTNENIGSNICAKTHDFEKINCKCLDRMEFLKSFGENIHDYFDLNNTLEILKAIESRGGNSITSIRKEYLAKRTIIKDTKVKVDDVSKAVANSSDNNSLNNTNSENDNKSFDIDIIEDSNNYSKNEVTNDFEIEIQGDEELKDKANDESINTVNNDTSKKENAKIIDTSKYEYIVSDNVTKEEVVNYLVDNLLDPVINSDKELGNIRTNVIRIKSTIKRDNWNVYSVVNYIINFSNSELGKKLSKELKSNKLPTFTSVMKDFVDKFGVKKN